MYTELLFALPPLPQVPPSSPQRSARPTASTYVSDISLDLSPVHVVGGEVGGGPENSFSIWGFLLLLFLHRRIIRKSEMNRAPGSSVG